MHREFKKLGIFAYRTNWELSLNKIANTLNRIKDTGVEIIDLTISNPTQANFYYPQDILKALNKKENLIYQPAAKGILSAREAVCTYYAHKGIAVSVENIFLTCSTSEAYAFLFRLLANPGDSILFPQPSYPLFDFLAKINDVGLSFYRLKYSDGWFLSQDTFKERLKGNRAVVVVNPNNPTGSFLSREEMDFVSNECICNDIPIICDEVFADYIFNYKSDDRGFPTFIGNKDVLTFTLGGLSKALGLPQMKVSWIIVDGPHDYVKEAIARLEVIADTFLSVNIASQNALFDWFKISSYIQNQILDRVRNNYAILVHACQETEVCECFMIEGGWYAVVKLKAVGDDFDEEGFVIDLLQHQNVFVHPGYFFDFDENGYIVISLLAQQHLMKEGICRVISQINKLE